MSEYTTSRLSYKRRRPYSKRYSYKMFAGLFYLQSTLFVRTDQVRVDKNNIQEERRNIGKDGKKR